MEQSEVIDNITLGRIFQPLTSTTRIEDIEIPEKLLLGGNPIKIPSRIRRKNIHFLVNEEAQLKKAAWITPTLAHILNSLRTNLTEDTQISELYRAKESLQNVLVQFVKNEILRDKHGRGAMGFVQANENVPEGTLLLSESSYKELCNRNPAWETCNELIVIRFPNLGPETTLRMKLLINTRPLHDYKTSSIFYRVPELRDLFLDESNPLDDRERGGVIEAFYMHPKTLKNSFQGDGDGDLIFTIIAGNRKPSYELVDLTRESGEFDSEDINTLISKSRRATPPTLEKWLPEYFDDIPIGQATYATRWNLYKSLSKYKDSSNPMYSAWEELAPQAIELIEFVMDVRKGHFSEAEINSRMQEISNSMRAIKDAQEQGDWFAKSVTCNTIQDIDLFIKEFPNLQKFVDFITGQNKMTMAKLLSEDN